MANPVLKMETNDPPIAAVRPPLVKGDPLLGNLRALLKNPYEFVKQSYAAYGPVFRFKAAHRSYVVMGGVEANRFVAGEGKQLFSVDGFWGETGRYMKCPHMLTMVDGEIHQYQRKVMAPALAQQNYKDHIDVMAQNVIDLINQRAQRQVLEFGPFARQMLSNQLSSTLHGYKAPHWKVETMIYAFNNITKVFGLRSKPRFMLNAPKQKYAEFILARELNKTMEKARQRLSAGQSDRSLYMDLILPKLEQKPEWFSEGDARGHAMLPYVGALDTIAATKGFIVLRLLQDPDLYQRVQKEVDSVFSQGIPDLATLKSMEDLNGLYREVMRLQPTAFGITRTAKEDFEFGGFQIQKGEDVLVFTTADHNNPLYFPNPDGFDIERYRAPRNEHKQPAYAPFGKGPHNCIGASLTELIMPLHLGLMLYILNFEAACNLKKVKVVFNPAPVLSDNFRVKVSLRRNL